MKTIDQQALDAKLQLGKLAEEMSELAELHNATGASSWATFDTWLGKEQFKRHTELAGPNTDDRRTQQLRGEIAMIARIRWLPLEVVTDLDKLKVRAEGLREQLTQWQNRGRPELRPAVEAAKHLSDRSNP